MPTQTSLVSQDKPSLKPSGELSAGVAMRKITPDLTQQPVYLAGFGRNRVATAIHDDLWARSLVISDGVTTIALVALDLIGLFRDDVLAIWEELSRREVEVDGTIIASTHTHSGPDTLGLWGPDLHTSGVDHAYLGWLRAQITDAIGEAAQNLRPVRLRAATRPVPGLARNAREADILDDELSVLRVEDEQGVALATVTNFPCHPEVLWKENTIITSDFPHFLRAAIEADGGGLAIHFSGDLGGMMTPNVSDHTFAEAQGMGERLAEIALDALAEAPTFIPEQVRWYPSEFDVVMNNPLLETARRRGLIHRQMTATNGETVVTTGVYLLALGPVQMLALPGEVLPRLGLKLRHLLPGPYRFLIGLANDELGYILDESEFHVPRNYFDPEDAYEESMSIGPRMGPMVYEVARALTEALS
ncbi:MAG: neutral/alkaline non-lysosomal ceramidase N-terminal domain-containing protein [Anaerolineae bacterium]|nr:neutral/alkaline non-lysosomal ceramidase N-terminal domain-containing protein [Anaerolineae bacterium]